MFDFASLMRPLQGLKSRAGALGEEITALNALRNRVQSAPATRADVKAMLAHWVDAKAAGFAGSFAATIREFVNRPALMQGHGRVHQVVSLISRASMAGDTESSQLDRTMCALFGPQVKQALIAVVDAMEWPEEGLPLAERAKEIDRIDQLLEKLQGELAGLTRQAAAAGINLGIEL